MKKMLHRIGVAIFIAFLASCAYAREVKFEASVDNKNIVLGESAQLGLTFYGMQDMPAPDISSIDGFEVRYLGPSTMMTVINGRMSSSVTHMYTLLPLRVGKFQLGPFSFKYQGDEYSSNSVSVEVVEEGLAKDQKREEDLTSALDLEDRLFLTLRADRARAYVNELIPVTVKLYVNRLNVSDIQLPTFVQEGFSKVEFKEPKQYREESGGIAYDVLEFKTNIFGTRPGDFKLGPAKVKCNLVVKKRLRNRPSRIDEFEDEFFKDSHFEDFFTRYERYPIELKSEDASITVSPLPNEGRPQDFSGAVGDYQFIFNSSPSKLHVGDPITLKMEINGKGNFNTVLAPKLENTEGFRVYEPQVKTEANRKAFTQVLIPESDRMTQMPKAVFAYFDPVKREYKTITHGPLPIQVEKSKEEAPAQVVSASPAALPERLQAPLASEKEELTRDIIYIKESLGRVRKRGYEIYKNRILLTFLPSPALFLLFLYTVYRRSYKLKNDARYSRRTANLRSARAGLKSLKGQLREASGDQKIFYDGLFKTLQDYLGSRLSLPSAGITFDTADHRLAAMGIDLNMRMKIRNLFEMCDQARFAYFKADEFRIRADFNELERIIKYLERLKI